MIKRLVLLATTTVLLGASMIAVQPQSAAQKEAARNSVREKLRVLLESAGQRRDINAIFRQSTQQPYNFVGMMTDGFKNVDSLEVLVGATPDETISVIVFPHYNGSYINIDKAKSPFGLLRRLINLNDHNFLYWGADDSGDVFCGYTITLESGFPTEALLMVLRSIRNTDQFIGQLRPLIDGTLPQ